MAYEFDKTSILVVDDNEVMLNLVKSLLQTFGVGRIITARDGGEGFEKFCEHNPDLIMTDWMMEPIDGITFARRVRTDTRSPNKFVPIVLMTGFSEKRRVMQARDTGVNEFLVKPFNVRELYRRVAQIIERPRQFVRSDDFFGPDRRRLRKEEYGGAMRRGSDVRSKDNLLHSSYLSTLINKSKDGY